MHNIVRQLIDTGVMSTDFVRSREFYRSFDQGTSKKAGEWNIEGDMADTQIMTLWLKPNLCDWRSHEWGLMGNEVTGDHGEVLSFYVYPLS